MTNPYPSTQFTADVTVAELVAALLKMPQNSTVWFMHSNLKKMWEFPIDVGLDIDGEDVVIDLRPISMIRMLTYS